MQKMRNRIITLYINFFFVQSSISNFILPVLKQTILIFLLLIIASLTAINLGMYLKYGENSSFPCLRATFKQYATNLLLDGLHQLIQLAANRFVKGNKDWEISEKDIETIFKHYRLSDGRRVLEWWKQGSSVATQVSSDRSFKVRLEEFNKRVRNLVESGNDPEKILRKFYPNYASDWIAKCKIQMDQYLWMSNNLKNLHYYVHMEDIVIIRDIWSLWV